MTDNKVQDWPTLMELIREGEMDPEAIAGYLTTAKTSQDL